MARQLLDLRARQAGGLEGDSPPRSFSYWPLSATNVADSGQPRKPCPLWIYNDKQFGYMYPCAAVWDGTILVSYHRAGDRVGRNVITMRAVIQRVSEASVTVEGQVVGRIGQGLLVFLGIGSGDTPQDTAAFAEKIANLRIFSDREGRFNHSVLDIRGAALVVSQFTLYADTRRGRRPSFTDAAAPEIAAPLVDLFAEALRERGVAVANGVFGAHMDIALHNDGPVTIVLDTAVFKEARSAH